QPHPFGLDVELRIIVPHTAAPVDLLVPILVPLVRYIVKDALVAIGGPSVLRRVTCFRVLAHGGTVEHPGLRQSADAWRQENGHAVDRVLITIDECPE